MQPPLIIDIDNPEFPSTLNPIASHSKIANFYKYRPPYTVDFFSKLSAKLKSSKNTNFLDLCCGRGELASGISIYAKKIYAVDGSKEMLSNSIQKNNVIYSLANVNTDELIFTEKFDHFLIGSAIHWIKQEALKRIIDSYLKRNGTVVITYPSFLFDPEEFSKPLASLNARFGKNWSDSVDLWGRNKLNQCGFKEINQVRILKNVEFDINFLFMNQLSYAYREFYEKVMTEPEAYKNEFINTISPFAKNGRLQAKLVNWAIIYSSN